MKRKETTPAESARTEDPGLSIAKEAAEVVHAESVPLERNRLYINNMKNVISTLEWTNYEIDSC